MEISKPKFEKYIFVCENERSQGACCGAGGQKLREILKQKIKDLGLASRVRVSRSGCLDVCEEGLNVLIMPDNIWFKNVQANDVDRILKGGGSDVR